MKNKKTTINKKYKFAVSRFIIETESKEIPGHWIEFTQIHALATVKKYMAKLDGSFRVYDNYKGKVINLC